MTAGMDNHRPVACARRLHPVRQGLRWLSSTLTGCDLLAPDSLSLRSVAASPISNVVAVVSALTTVAPQLGDAR